MKPEAAVAMFREMVRCNHPIYYFRLSPTLELQESDIPKPKTFMIILRKAGILESIARNGIHGPTVITDQSGLTWITDADSSREIHMFGPIFPTQFALYSYLQSRLEESIKRKSDTRLHEKQMLDKDTSNKIRSVFQSRMNDGKRCSGSIPYGYNRLPGDKQTLVVDPVASEVVKRIFKMASEGINPGEIARRLQADQVLIPSAYTAKYHPRQSNNRQYHDQYAWSGTVVNEILNRQEYLGHTVLRKSISENFKLHKRRATTEEERLVFENTHEPIIDQATWDLAHSLIKHCPKRTPAGTYTHRLSGLVYCADCGSRMSFNGAPAGSKNSPSFRCGGYSNGKGCTYHHISAKSLENKLSDLCNLVSAESGRC